MEDTQKTVAQLRLAWVFILGCVVSGCSSISFNTPPPSIPFFPPTDKDTAALSHLTRELDAMAAQCSDPGACDQVHYARGLVALFESREAARTSFRRVNHRNPASSPVAASSVLWLQLLEGGSLPWVSNEQERAFLEITAELVREWIDRKLVVLREAKKASTASTKVDPPNKVDPPTHGVFLSPQKPESDRGELQTLERQVKERDSRITELTTQLEALKTIERDVNIRKKPLRPPASLTPATTDRPQ